MDLNGEAVNALLNNRAEVMEMLEVALSETCQHIEREGVADYTEAMSIFDHYTTNYVNRYVGHRVFGGEFLGCLFNLPACDEKFQALLNNGSAYWKWKLSNGLASNDEEVGGSRHKV